LRLYCSACHASQHAGTLTIIGAGDHAEVRRPAAPLDAIDQSAKLQNAITRTYAKDALVKLGWTPAIARSATDAAIAALESDAPIDHIIREALRLCPRPSSRTT
jgi:Holliday junction resolvasome RuvABC DNA-binding subunit